MSDPTNDPEATRPWGPTDGGEPEGDPPTPPEGMPEVAGTPTGPPPGPSGPYRPPPGGPGDGEGDDDEERPWYKDPRIVGGIAVGVIVLALLLWWALGGDDDGEDDSATSTTETTTATTSTAATTPPATTAAPVTTAAPAPATTAAPAPPPANQAAIDLELARGNWTLRAGQSYILGYLASGEGEGYWCVEGIAGDATTWVEFAQGQGCGASGPSPYGVLGVEGWHDQIAAWIDSGELISATFDSTGRPTVVESTQQDGLVITFEWLVPPG